MLPQNFRFSEIDVLNAAVTECAIAVFGADFQSKLNKVPALQASDAVSNDRMALHFAPSPSDNTFKVYFVAKPDPIWMASNPTPEIPAELTFRLSGKVSKVYFRQHSHAVNNPAGFTRIEYAEDGSISSAAQAIPGGVTHLLTEEEVAKKMSAYKSELVTKICNNKTDIIGLCGISATTLSTRVPSHLSPI